MDTSGHRASFCKEGRQRNLRPCSVTLVLLMAINAAIPVFAEPLQAEGRIKSQTSKSGLDEEAQLKASVDGAVKSDAGPIEVAAGMENLARWYAAHLKIDRAVETLKATASALEPFPNDREKFIDILMELGTLYAGNGEKELGTQAFERASSLCGPQSLAHQNLRLRVLTDWLMAFPRDLTAHKALIDELRAAEGDGKNENDVDSLMAKANAYYQLAPSPDSSMSDSILNYTSACNFYKQAKKPLHVVLALSGEVAFRKGASEDGWCMNNGERLRRGLVFAASNPSPDTEKAFGSLHFYYIVSNYLEDAGVGQSKQVVAQYLSFARRCPQLLILQARCHQLLGLLLFKEKKIVPADSEYQKSISLLEKAEAENHYLSVPLKSPAAPPMILQEDITQGAAGGFEPVDYAGYDPCSDEVQALLALTILECKQNHFDVCERLLTLIQQKSKFGCRVSDDIFARVTTLLAEGYVADGNLPKATEKFLQSMRLFKIPMPQSNGHSKSVVGLKSVGQAKHDASEKSNELLTVLLPSELVDCLPTEKDLIHAYILFLTQHPRLDERHVLPILRARDTHST